MHPSLASTAHRPWPLPVGPWVMAQTWHDLLFAHWPISAETLRPLGPPQLELDRFDHECWLGVIPFWMSGVRARGIPAIPGLSSFPELNVRTYVTRSGRPGVYFFSLDAASLPAVRTARAIYHLPYFLADMQVKDSGQEITYSSSRRNTEAEFRALYAPVSSVETRRPGSIEHWLTERYCLYTVHEQCVYQGEIHHVPWPLQNASAEIKVNTMANAAGISFPEASPLLHFAKRLDVVVWPLRRAE